MKKKKFSETKVGQWLKEKAPDVLTVAGDALPYPFSAGIKLVKSLIANDKDISPEVKEEFSQLEAEFMKDQHEIEKLHLQDVHDARQMQIAALSQNDLFSKRFIYYLAAFSVVCGFTYIFCVTYIRIPVENQRFADAMTGVMTTVVFGMIFSFFYGSSKSSKDKTEQITKMMETKNAE